MNAAVERWSGRRMSRRQNGEADKRTVLAVLTRRHRLGIPNLVPARHVWAQKQIALLGTMSDRKVVGNFAMPSPY